ncbi:MAG TPA: TolC family protein [Alphaproteobacteria bacterium]|nr:TolC family protein [Alphaproteobacteria bacterium]
MVKILAKKSLWMMSLSIVLFTNNEVSAVSERLTLKQALEIALTHRPEIISSEQTIEARKQEVDQAFADYLPQVGGHAVRAYAGNNARAAAIGGITNPLILKRASLGLSVYQMITDFGRTSDIVSAADAKVNAQIAKSFSVRDRVIFEVTRAYYNTLLAQQILKVAQETLAVRLTLFEKIQLLAKEKLKAFFDVDIATQSVDEAKLLLLKAQNDLDDAQAELSQALGYGELIHFDLSHQLRIEPLTTKLAPLLEIAKKQNPDLESLRAEVSQRKFQYEAAVAEHYPTIGAIGYTGANPSRNKSELNSTYAVAGVTLDVPFYTGGRITATAKQMLFEMKALEMDLVAKENKLIRDVRVAWNNVQSSYQNIGVLKELFINNAKALELAQASYEFGLISIVDLVQEHLRKTQAEISYSTARYEYLINCALLNLLLGDGEKIC